MIELAEIEAARARIAGAVVRTPLVRLHVADAPAEIYLKLENLQPINSFKIRGATNAVMLAPAGAWDLPDPDAIVIPYGGGGLTTGIASAVKALRPGTRIVTAEPDTAAALAAALAAGHPADVDYRPSFVDGSGSRRVLDSMWPLVAPLVDDAVAIPVADVAAAVRTLAERVRVIAEGAGALAPAAALSGRAGTGKIVCVVSGGNINLDKLAEILGGADG